MSPRPSLCDGFTGNLPSYSDRELGPAETSALEQHLEGCARCQGRLKELETVSDVLKGWDARMPAGQTAAVRLQNAVLARIEEDGLRRRREVLWTRVRRAGLAAAVLLAIGIPGALGLSTRRDDPGDALVAFEVSHAPRAEAPALDGNAPALSAAPIPPEAFLHRPLGAAEVPSAQSLLQASGAGVLEAEQRDALMRVALAPQVELEQEARFRQLVGVRGVWAVDPATGSRLYVTREAAQVFGADDPATGMLHIARLHRLRSQRFTNTTPAAPVDLGKSPADLLRGVLSGDEGTRSWRTLRSQWHLGAPGSPKHRLSAFALAPRSRAAGLDVLDPLAAQDLRLLTFAPSGTSVTTVVAIVEGNDLPIFLPAGQILAGGEVDRVVTRPVWLPASRKRTPFEVPCAVVSFGRARPEDGIRLTRWVAGPGLRGLLAAGASAQAILEHVRWLTGFGASLEGSLLDVYERKDSAALLDSEKLVSFSAKAPAGFLVADADGRFLGLEHVAIAGEPGALAVRRLLHGYALEGLRRSVKRDLRAAVNAAVLALLDSEKPLRLPPVSSGAAVQGLARGTLVDDAYLVDALRLDDRSVWVSALPR